MPKTKIDFRKENDPPIQVSWGDIIEIRLKRWANVLVYITQYLVVDHGDLTAADCSVMPESRNSKNAILSTSPTNPNKTKFQGERIGKLFLNKHGDGKTVIKKACRLADVACLDPDLFTAGFSKLNG